MEEKNIELGSILPKRDFNYVNDIVRGLRELYLKKIQLRGY